MTTATQQEHEVVEKVPKQLYVGGEWRDPGEGGKLAVEDPSTGEPLCEVADARPDDAMAALEAAAAAQEEWAAHPPRERGEILRRAFEELTERAESEREPARRAELLRDALALWRGEPLAEFAREPFAIAAARRLADVRLDALERRIAADLELGRQEQLVRELTALVRDEPLRERLRGHLMLALYRSGRQADALAV
jgi:hypothetical protein